MTTPKKPEAVLEVVVTLETARVLRLVVAVADATGSPERAVIEALLSAADRPAKRTRRSRKPRS